MFLTLEERNKFATWLEERAHENQQIAKPMREIGGDIMEQVAQQQEAMAVIFEHVAKHLRSIEDSTASSGDKGVKE